jgi:hypothetical protein
MAKRQKLNSALLTDEEAQQPMGLGLLMAATRLGLKYLDGPGPILQLLTEYANEAWAFSMAGGLPARKFWSEMNKKADKLATILKGQDPACMATSWFTDPHQLRAHLYEQLEKERPNDPPNASWRKDPIREYARSFMAFYLDLSEGAVTTPSNGPAEKQAADHMRKYIGLFVNMDSSMFTLISVGGASESGVNPEAPHDLGKSAYG